LCIFANCCQIALTLQGTDEDVKKKIEDEDLRQDPYLFEPLAQAAYHFRTVPEQNYNYTEQPRGYTSKAPVFRFIDFIPRVTSKFYTYRGSLSWPPCFGYVIWSVYEKRLLMSKRQVFIVFFKISFHLPLHISFNVWFNYLLCCFHFKV